MNWFSRLFTRDRRYDDVSVSIREHLEERIEELIRRGHAAKLSASTARRSGGSRGGVASGVTFVRNARAFPFLCQKEAQEWGAGHHG